ncbi:hypothetical protein Plhal703r1_c07g0040381 [Plasmopara halstedii]
MSLLQVRVTRLPLPTNRAAGGVTSPVSQQRRPYESRVKRLFSILFAVKNAEIFSCFNSACTIFLACFMTKAMSHPLCQCANAQTARGWHATSFSQ